MKPDRRAAWHVVMDRDGTLIRHVPYLCDPRQVEVLPDVVDGLEALIAAGATLYLHTNQSGIGRGYFTAAEAEACNAAMIEQLGLGPHVFAEICIAPEAPDGEIVNRKPSPAWGAGLMERRGIGREELVYVGDAVSDLMTAKNLGCVGIGVNTGEKDLNQALAEAGLPSAFPVFDTFSAAAARIVGMRERQCLSS